MSSLMAPRQNGPHKNKNRRYKFKKHTTHDATKIEHDVVLLLLLLFIVTFLLYTYIYPIMIVID